MADLGRLQPLDRQQVLLPVRHEPWSQKPTEAVNARAESGQRFTASEVRSAPEHAGRQPLCGHAIAARRHRQDLDVVPVQQQVGGCAAIGPIVAAAGSGPVDAVAGRRVLVPGFDDHAAAHRMHGPDIEYAGNPGLLICRRRRNPRPHVVRNASNGSNETMSPTFGPSSPTWRSRPIVPTIPARAITTMPRMTLDMPLELLPFACIAAVPLA